MFDEFKKRYQEYILEDVKRPSHATFRKVFPYILLSFIVLQVIYYFIYFNGKIFHYINRIHFYHVHNPLIVWPKTIVHVYDHLLLFLLYLFFIFIFLISAFMAFDFSQRNAVIRKLLQQKNSNEPPSD